MSDSIRELIVKNRKAALETITVANGYDNTIASVQRRMQGGQTFTAVPVIIITEDDEDKTGEAAHPYIYKRLMIALSVVTRIDEAADSRSADEVLNSLRADVEKAWMADNTCGGYAIDTDYEGSGPLDVIEGQPEIGSFIMFSVQYRHKSKDPKTQ